MSNKTKQGFINTPRLWAGGVVDMLLAPVSKKYRSFRIALVAALVILSLAAPFVAKADTIAHPDSTPTLDMAYFHVARNLILPGDTLFYGLYNIPYATIPTVPADQTFIFRLRADNSTADIGDMVPFVHFDKGYNKGVVAFYFSPDAGIVWGTAYRIRISENPSQFAAPIATDVIISANSSYTTMVSQADNQAEVATNLYEIGQKLESQYSKTLFSALSGVMVLTSDGEPYFRGAIHGLQVMVPALFVVQNIIGNGDVTENWTMAQAESYQHRFDGTWVGVAENATAAQLKVATADIAMSPLVVVICLAFTIFSGWKFKRTEPGIMCSTVILMMALLLGWIPKSIFASIYQSMGIFVSWMVFGARG